MPREKGPDKKVQRALIAPFKIERMIHLVRGQKVILDADLAMLYGVSTNA